LGGADVDARIVVQAEAEEAEAEEAEAEEAEGEEAEAEEAEAEEAAGMEVEEDIWKERRRGTV